MADDEERLPPPPSYEEAQRLLNSEVTGSTADNSDPRSIPLLGHQTDISSISQSCIPVTYSTLIPPCTGTTVFNEGYLPLHRDSGSGSYPIFVCGACGARQNFGQFSPITSQGLPSQTITSPSPIYVGIPVITNQQNLPRQVTGSASSRPTGSQSMSENRSTQQQRNVAVHYNPNQGRVQSQVDNTDSSSSNADEDNKTLRSCSLFFFIVVFFGVVLLLSFTIS